MNKLFGHTDGLKKNQVRALESFYNHRIPPEFIITPELAEEMTSLSHELNRQLGLLINRAGHVIWVIVGDAQKIVIPDTPDYRTQAGKLKGLLCIHTHLKGEKLTQDDLTDLALLRLDLLAAVTITDKGMPDTIHISHIMPGTDGSPYQILNPLTPEHLDFDRKQFVSELETEITSSGFLYDTGKGIERAILVSVTTKSKREAKESLIELQELTESNNVHVIDSVLQIRKKTDPKLLMGKGKLNSTIISALQKAVTLLIFDTELNPAQIRNITNHADMKVIDRTQLILDIFAQRAKSREGKLQVELAQLKYMLPRLITKNTAMSRLTGGIGGRGPGETKLEINRRRVRDKINQIENQLKTVRKQRSQQKARRNKKGLPTISIVGYTNAGKSTLLNTLTQSDIYVKDQLFATLDPSSRRMKFPRDVEVIITDTVGFIRDLPKELIESFKATLEELEGADILLHVIDISNPNHEKHMASVNKILTDLKLDNIPVILVFNKMDLADKDQLNKISNYPDSTLVSAMKKSTLMPLVNKLEMIAGKLML